MYVRVLKPWRDARIGEVRYVKDPAALLREGVVAPWRPTREKAVRLGERAVKR